MHRPNSAAQCGQKKRKNFRKKDLVATHNVDIAVIGAGPAGLFTVFEAGFLGYTCAVMDSLPQVGGQLAELYPEKPIYDIPGHPTILAGELVEKLKEQIAPYAPQFVLNSPVDEVVRTENGFSLHAAENTVNAKVIVIAAGGGVFTPRKPAIERLEEFEATSVFYAVKNKSQFDGKELVIAGGGDSAVDWAVALAESAKHVHVVHRRADFRAAEDTVQKMHNLAKAGKITLHTPCQMKAVDGAGGQLQKVVIKNFEGEQTEIAADALLCFFGLLPTLGPIEKWGVDLAQKKITVNPATMQTNQKGILAVGDIADYTGKISLILVGFAEAAIAAKTAQSLIDPDKKFKLVYSTSKGVPQ